MVNNYYKPGTATKKSRIDRIVNPSSPYGKFFLTGNYLYGNEAVTKDNKLGVKAGDIDSVWAANEFKVEPIVVQSAERSYELILASAGASFKRDAVDKRVVEEVRTGISTSGKNHHGIIDSQKDVGGWPDLKSVPAPDDTDADGMPDAWEKANKLNPGDASDACKKAIDKRYDNIEVYLNNLVEEVMTIQ